MEISTESTSMYGSRTSPRLQPLGSSPKKRRLCLDEEDGMKENKGTISAHVCHHNFIKVPKADSIFQTELWKCKLTTLYQPLTEDIMINLTRIEQISFQAGSFFVADDSGQYSGTKEGNVLHLWRYSEKDNKLFISRTFLFTDLQTYMFIRRQLEEV